MFVCAMAPLSPAANANGTVNPSDMPITMSRTTSLAVKWRSVCGVCGILSSRIWLISDGTVMFRQYSQKLFCGRKIRNGSGGDRITKERVRVNEYGTGSGSDRVVDSTILQTRLISH